MASGAAYNSARGNPVEYNEQYTVKRMIYEAPQPAPEQVQEYYPKAPPAETHYKRAVSPDDNALVEHFHHLSRMQTARIDQSQGLLNGPVAPQSIAPPEQKASGESISSTTINQQVYIPNLPLKLQKPQSAP